MKSSVSPLIAALLVAMAFPALAQSPSPTNAYLTARTIEARDAAERRLELIAPTDADAAYVLAAGKFFGAVERLAQAFFRHGLDAPRSMFLPAMQLPVPENAQPEPLDYDRFRGILSRFHDDLQRAADDLSAIPPDATIGVDVNFARFGLDFDGDGTIGNAESLAAIVQALARRPVEDNAAALSFRFDRADGYWLQGYAHFLMANMDFWLAHDFRETFDNSFHMLFPRAGLPLQDILVPRHEGAGGALSSEWRIADFISFVHLIRWEVVEPDRRRDTRRHLLEMIRLSRENWKAILAETDNEREWLPGPHQPGINPLTGLEVAQQQVDAWHQTLTVAERLLTGEALLPHFRIAGRGINMRRFFDEPHRFDLVLMLTGPGAALWLEAGDLISANQWRQVQNQFGRQGFMGFALWFN